MSTCTTNNNSCPPSPTLSQVENPSAVIHDPTCAKNSVPACDERNLTGADYNDMHDLPMPDGRSELIEETKETGSQFQQIPLGQSRRDLEFVINRMAESFRKLYPTVNFIPMNRELSRPDTLYREQIFKKFEKPVPVHAHFQFNPPEKVLRKYGLEVEDVCLATFSNRILNKQKLKVKTGDRIEYLGISYEIITVKLLDYFCNTQVPLCTVAVLKQLAKR